MKTSKRIGDLHRLADYVINQGERYSLKDDLIEDYKDSTRTEKRKYAENDIWFIATKVLSGRATARKLLTELLDEVDRYILESNKQK